MPSQVYTLIQMQIAAFAKTISENETAAKKYRNYWKWAQAVVLTIGIITPFIVFFRKSPIFPAQFWVYWCSITPPLSALISFLSSHFAWKVKATTFASQAKQLKKLENKANLRLATTKEAELPTLYEWLLDEVATIEEER
jgi:hypothetical protein